MSSITKTILKMHLLIHKNTILKQHSYIVNHRIQPQNLGSYIIYLFWLINIKYFNINMYLVWVQIRYYSNKLHKNRRFCCHGFLLTKTLFIIHRFSL